MSLSSIYIEEYYRAINILDADFFSPRYYNVFNAKLQVIFDEFNFEI